MTQPDALRLPAKRASKVGLRGSTRTAQDGSATSLNVPSDRHSGEFIPENFRRRQPTSPTRSSTVTSQKMGLL